MSTRSATIVKQKCKTSATDYTVEELFRFYRHCDGYPEGHGLDMAKAFCRAHEKGTADKDRWLSSGLNNRNWAQKCFAELFAGDCDLEVEPKGHEHGDLDYLYVVEGESDWYGGKHNMDELPVTIAVYSCRFDASYDGTVKQEPEFVGNPYEYVEWCRGL